MGAGYSFQGSSEAKANIDAAFHAGDINFGAGSGGKGFSPLLMIGLAAAALAAIFILKR